MNKKQKEARKLINKNNLYSIEEAVELLPKISTSNFTGSVELTINLKLNEKNKNKPLRSSISFPNEFGEETKILVLTQDASEVEKAKKAGATYAGFDEFIKKIEKDWTDFDILITTPKCMPNVAKLGKYLGRKGLMPNPKNQTVTTDIEKVIKMYKQGKKDFKKNEQGSIKLVIGKLDMSKEQLIENFNEFKRIFSNESKQFGADIIQNVYLSPTMGPGLKISINELMN